MKSVNTAAARSSLAAYANANPFVLLEELTNAAAVPAVFPAVSLAEAAPIEHACYSAEEFEPGVVFSLKLEHAMAMRIKSLEKEVIEEEALQVADGQEEVLAIVEEPQSPILQSIFPEPTEEASKVFPEHCTSDYPCCHECQSLYSTMSSPSTSIDSEEDTIYYEASYEDPDHCHNNYYYDYYDCNYNNYYDEDGSSNDMTYEAIYSSSYPVVDYYCGYDYHTYYTCGLYVPIVSSY